MLGALSPVIAHDDHVDLLEFTKLPQALFGALFGGDLTAGPAPLMSQRDDFSFILVGQVACFHVVGEVSVFALVSDRRDHKDILDAHAIFFPLHNVAVHVLESVIALVRAIDSHHEGRRCADLCVLHLSLF